MKYILSLAVAVPLCFAMLPSASAAEPVTTNQPNNGFYEGADPEWATLHSTNAQGTEVHRQYHRDAVKAHLAWHAQNPSLTTTGYAASHRIMHQLRNIAHRLFHTTPVNP
jgi:hypothetical protein